MELEKKSEKLFDKNAYKYNSFAKQHIVEYYLKKRINFINKLVKSSDIVLDVGCGTGTTIAGVKSNKKYGVDFSSGMLKEAKQFKNIIFKKMNTKNLLFKDEFFDFVYSANVLYYVESLSKGLRKSLSEIYRVLKKGGRVLIIDPNKRNPYWKLFVAKESYDTGKEKHVYDKTVIQELRDLGFKNIRLYYRGFLPAFCPKFLMPLAKLIDFLVENSPFAKFLCSHYYIIAEK